MSSGLPIDLILFAMVAAFLVLRLRSVLGRRTGFERPPQGEVVKPLGGEQTRGVQAVLGLVEQGGYGGQGGGSLAYFFRKISDQLYS